MKSESFTLRPMAPFRLDYTVWALRRRPHNAVDRWDGAIYRRVLVLQGEPVQVAVEQPGGTEKPHLRVTLSGKHLLPQAKDAAANLLRRMLGLRVDLSEFYRLAATDKLLFDLVDRFRGVRPPRFPTVFEGLVNAVACQQLSLSVGIWLLNRLAERSGPSVPLEGSEQHGFPSPADIFCLGDDDLRGMGFSQAKAHNLQAIARAVCGGLFDVEQTEHLANDAVVEKLRLLRGIGRWSAEYVLLRGLNRMNVFPGDDVGARNRLSRWLGRDGAMDYEAVQAAVRRWQPFGGLIYFHLLLAGLEQSGALHKLSEQPGASAKMS